MTHEGQIVKTCLDYLKVYGAFCWRNNTGALKDKTERPVYFGKPGSSDILGLLPGGRFIAVENGYKEGLSIDRIDVNGNYQPSNCRWAERITQMNNRRNNHLITLNGRTETVKNWSRITGVSYNVIASRLSRGWNEVEAITFPVSKTRKYEHGA